MIMRDRNKAFGLPKFWFPRKSPVDSDVDICVVNGDIATVKNRFMEKGKTYNVLSEIQADSKLVKMEPPRNIVESIHLSLFSCRIPNELGRSHTRQMRYQ